MPQPGGRAIIVLTTCPNRRVAMRMARTLIERRLAACVNLLGGVQSVYRWQGRVERSAEILLVIKSSQARFAALRDGIVSLHPYELPEVLSFPAPQGSPEYLEWLLGNVR